ncbi:hypothetical protein VNO77_22971 [Canavalia gladiata]|uniref:Uncharacterized protein n=1 Tax=Canavalia gladiata TaxID=3824 RepID=A0AAN9L3L6_CANGL
MDGLNMTRRINKQGFLNPYWTFTWPDLEVSDQRYRGLLSNQLCIPKSPICLLNIDSIDIKGNLEPCLSISIITIPMYCAAFPGHFLYMTLAQTTFNAALVDSP